MKLEIENYLKEKGFRGVDVNLETSLFEYNLLIREDGDHIDLFYADYVKLDHCYTNQTDEPEMQMIWERFSKEEIDEEYSKIKDNQGETDYLYKLLELNQEKSFLSDKFYMAGYKMDPNDIESYKGGVWDEY
jgi:hypothetical protein